MTGSGSGQRGVRIALVAGVVALGLACAGEVAAPGGSAPTRVPTRLISNDVPTTQDERYVAVIAALEAVDVASRHAGTLLEVRVRPGDRVAAGDVLARLDETPMREALAMALAERRSARAVLAQRVVEIAEAKRALEIEQELFARGIGAQKHLEEAGFALQKTHKAREYALAQVAEQSARIEQLERQLTEAVIAAPFAGTISLRYRDPGALVSAGAAIARVIRTDSLWVRFAVPADRAAHLGVGDFVTVKLASPRASLPAQIRHISPELDPAARMVFVEAKLDAPDHLQGKLRAGLPAWVERTPSPAGQ